MKFPNRMLTAAVMMMGMMFASAIGGCSANSVKNDPYRLLDTAVVAENIVVKDTTLAVNTGLIKPADTVKEAQILTTAELGLELAIPLATASGTPTPTPEQPNPVTLAQLTADFSILKTSLAELHAAI